MKHIRKLRWYYFTRGLGGFTAIYELLIDKTSERGTLFLASLGLLGLDSVSRRVEEKKKEE